MTDTSTSAVDAAERDRIIVVDLLVCAAEFQAEGDILSARMLREEARRVRAAARAPGEQT